MKKLFLLLGLVIALSISTYAQDNSRSNAYHGIFEYSDGTDSKKWYAFEATSSTSITAVTIYDQNGNAVSNALTTLITSNAGGALKVGGLYVLPYGYYGTVLTVTGPVKKLLW